MFLCSDDYDTKCSKLLKASLRGMSGYVFPNKQSINNLRAVLAGRHQASVSRGLPISLELSDGKTKVVASSRKVIHALLHFHFSVAVKSAVIHKEEFSQCGYLHL